MTILYTFGEPNESSEYRWYLCVQQSNPTKWDCVRKQTAEQALNPYFYGERPMTKAIPISKWKPRILDPLILHSSLHPTIRLTM
jgi:hypothetical protein